VFDEMFGWNFHWLFNFLWCRSETMDKLFNAQVRFNGGNPYLFIVWVDVTLKDLKDPLNEINQWLNPWDTMEDVQYTRPSLFKSQKIMLACWSIWLDGYQARGGMNNVFEKLFGDLIKFDFNEIDYWNLTWIITINESTKIKYMWNKILS